MPARPKEVLAKRLYSLRSQHGLTQESFAEKAGISYKYYQAIEEGRRVDLRLSTLTRLAEAHHITISELIGETPVASTPVRYRSAPKGRK